MDCKHDISQLIGTAEGIRCKACGKLFKAMPTKKVEIPAPEPAPAKEPEPVKEAEPAPKAPAKKTTNTKKGAKK